MKIRSWFSLRLVPGLVIGLIAGASMQRFIPHWARNEVVSSAWNGGMSERSITHDRLLPTISSLARDRNWSTKADFEKRFQGYDIHHLSDRDGFRGSPPLSPEHEQYLAVTLRREDRADNRTPRPYDKKALLDPDFHPRRRADGSPILAEDVQTPSAEIWYLLAAFNKTNGLCNWWCVFVSP